MYQAIANFSYQNFEQETDQIEPGLDPTKSLVKDEAERTTT